ncbi:hypothetical protein NPX13_g9255 [Xylaria arbuscula]|uniref:Microbial-type PARG catalytic domain-containing protein n=1 Tax=Xylaria arbuscula TaxID=114810 RepID=A0A9W8N6X2_9PEZI|nr:hypothetical protein NPX13_g9255 [Xylaria arbuscula]
MSTEEGYMSDEAWLSSDFTSDSTSHSSFTSRPPPDRTTLASTARETLSVLPGLLLYLPDIDAEDVSVLLYHDVAMLDPVDCPQCPLLSNPELCGTRVTVVNQDALDAAIEMMPEPEERPAYPGLNDHWRRLAIMKQGWSDLSQRVALLNLASDTTPGGGWMNGIMA